VFCVFLGQGRGGGTGYVGERRIEARWRAEDRSGFSILFRSIRGGQAGLGRGPVSGRTRAPDVRALESLILLR
jgi:hypothetical protein